MILKRNEPQQAEQEQERETPGQMLVRLSQSLAIILASLLGTAVVILAIIGHFDWIKEHGIWFLLAGGVLLLVRLQGFFLLSLIHDHRDRNAKRGLTEAQKKHLEAKAAEIQAAAQIKAAEAWQKAHTLPFDPQGNLAFFDHLTRQVSQLTGQAPEFPQLTHQNYAPRLTGLREEKPQDQQLALPKATVPTGRELLLNGAVERALADGRIILGPQDDGTMETFPLKRCFSTLISGLPYTGKSTSVFWIAGQLVIIGSRIWVVDPHMNFQDEEGNRSLAAELDALSDSFVFEPCDDDPRAVIPRVRWMYKELCKRQEPGFIVRAQDTIIGIMDEFNTVATGIDPNLTIVQHRQQPLNFGQTIALLEREGRKYGIHFMLIGHKWAQQDIGGDNAVRTNATTYICHKLNDQRQAETLLSGRDAKRMLELAVGEYLITGSAWNKPVTKITTPLISALDLPVLLQIKERGVQVRNQGNVIAATSMPDLPMKQSRATESLDEFTEEEAWGGEPSEESEDDPSIIPLRKSHVPPQVSLEDARAAYDKGAKTIDKLAAALKIEPWQARKLMSQIRWQNDQQQQSEAE